jgi:hypothetical protein
VDVLGRSGECPNRNPQEGGSFLEKEQKRDVERGFCGLGRRKKELLAYLLATWAPPARGMRGQSATHLQTICEVRGRSGAPARMVRFMHQNL